MAEIRAATDLIVYQKAWLDFACDCGNLAPSDYTRLSDLCREVGAMLGAMLFDPAPFLLRLS